MFGYCQDGRDAYRSLSPVVETATRLQYATIIGGPVLVTKEMSADWIDGVDEEGYEYLLCLETVDLEDGRVTHQREWTPARKMVPSLFPGTPLSTPWGPRLGLATALVVAAGCASLQIRATGPVFPSAVWRTTDGHGNAMECVVRPTVAAPVSCTSVLTPPSPVTDRSPPDGAPASPDPARRAVLARREGPLPAGLLLPDGPSSDTVAAPPARLPGCPQRFVPRR